MHQVALVHWEWFVHGKRFLSWNDAVDEWQRMDAMTTRPFRFSFVTIYVRRKHAVDRHLSISNGTANCSDFEWSSEYSLNGIFCCLNLNENIGVIQKVRMFNTRALGSLVRIPVPCTFKLKVSMYWIEGPSKRVQNVLYDWNSEHSEHSKCRPCSLTGWHPLAFRSALECL